MYHWAGGKSMVIKKRYIVIGSLWAAIILINILAWNSTVFCDWYISHIFPIWVESYGRLTGMFSFSVGEIMLLLFVSSIVIFLFVGIAAAVCKIIYRIQKRKRNFRLDFGIIVWVCWSFLLVSVSL